VVLSDVSDIGECVCDMTQDTCDYLCCCDKDCPATIIGTWLNDTNSVCLDKRILISSIFFKIYISLLGFYFKFYKSKLEY